MIATGMTATQPDLTTLAADLGRELAAAEHELALAEAAYVAAWAKVNKLKRELLELSKQHHQKPTKPIPILDHYEDF